MSLRQKVLQSFKNIHRARTQVFGGDVESLAASRQKINEEFQKNKNEDDLEEITKLVGKADEAAGFMRSMIIQAELNEEKDRYEVNLTKDTKFYKNMPFDINWKPPKRRKRGKENTGCCSENTDSNQ